MLKERLFDLLLGGLAGFVLAADLSTVCYDQSVRRLQAYTSQVALNAAAITLRARARADSLQRHADSLAHARQPIVLQARLETTSAAELERSLADQRSTADSNVVLRQEVRLLHDANGGLWEALQNAEQQIGDERRRGDSLYKIVGVLNADIQALNQRVARLRGGGSSFLRLTWKAVKVGGLVYGGYRCGRQHCV